ncbi:RNA polymerase sigma factor [Pseudobythopirellula maris]|uniref:RNA polymerase sigma factor n=1 Tax=Pseudobythopirellula maris TaxID=2527991 RepID=A0A5C5ZRC3_9BACT|nr:sigma-70 family RNA polymerase sigma factor [Pseudobythopirellula maris]TWT89786.1 RNA polymerase sigma factor [Pseudobythopirellula maris]
MNDDQRRQRFVELLTAHQRDIYSYVSMLMAGDEASADVVQEASIDLWKNHAMYDFQRPFLPWALKFAYHRVLAHRKARGRSRLVFSDEFVRAMSVQCETDPTPADTRLAALRNCLESLPEEQRKLIHDRYQGVLSVKSIALRMGVTPNNVSAQLYRIRAALSRCVEARLPTGPSKRFTP